MDLKLIFSLIAITVILFILIKQGQKAQLPPLEPFSGRPVVMIVIDSMMDQPLQEAIQLGRAPAMKYLKEHGHYYPRVVSSFPTMSVCIDSTLLTGTTPNKHLIFGLTYFHKQEQRMVNFGTGLRESITFGIKDVLTDSLMKLNQQFLSKEVETIHEAYKGATASINAIVYRGRFEQKLKAPWIANLFGFMPRTISTLAPKFFSFGALKKLDPKSGHDQAWFGYGINDKFSRMELVSLIKNDRLPPFSIIYLPGNDDYVHRKGVSEIKGIEKADQEIQEILHAFPTWEEAIQNVTFIVMGDSGQANMIPDQNQAFIDLRQLFSRYTIMPIKQKHPEKKDQLVLCVNERMAYVYVIDDQLSLQEVIEELKKESRLDIISWHDDQYIYVISGQMEGLLKFKTNGEYRDEYGQSWELEGDLSILDLTVQDEKQIQYGVYPDVLLRLSGVMETADRVVVITCSPGYEMVGESSPAHKGAAHGSLHHLDSLVPMIVCGTDTQPENLRFIDFKKWILQLIEAPKEGHTSST